MIAGLALTLVVTLGTVQQTKAVQADPAARPDLECLAIGVWTMAGLAGTPGPGPRATRPIVAYSTFYLGRLNQRDPQIDWAGLAVALSADLDRESVTAGAVSCEATVAAAVTPLIEAGHAAGLDLELD